MSCRTETKVLGDCEYSVTQWPADKALLMKLKLLKIIGPSFASLVENKDDETAALTGALDKLFANSSPEEIVSIVKDSIVLNVSCNGTKITDSRYVEKFSGDDLMDVYKLFFFVVQVNYGGFLKGQLADSLLAKFKENL